MSDVDGIYDKPPSHDNARVIHTFIPSDESKVEFGAKSNVGTGGMESKVKSALWALDNGTSVVICNGMKYRTIRKIIDGEKVGTFFARNNVDGQPAEILAKNGNYSIPLRDPIAKTGEKSPTNLFTIFLFGT